MAGERLAALNIEQTRSRAPLAGEMFNVVDGLRYPELLVMSDRDPEDVNASNRRIVIPDSANPLIIERTLAGIGAGSTAKSFDLGRGLLKYEEKLGLRKNGLGGVISELQSEFGGQAVRLVDLGCGNGPALSEILRMKGVDRKGSVGVTINDPTSVVKDVRDRVAFGNVLFFAPGKKRFHAATSAAGAITYHPLNSLSDEMFGVLQALNMIEENGVLITSALNGVIPDLLNSTGITETPKSLSRHFTNTRRALRLKRRPVIDEVKELIGADKNGRYLV